MVERDFPDGLGLPVSDEGETAARGIIACNADSRVTWIHPYVSEDKHKTFCIYDGPDPDAIRQAAEANGLPVGQITRVSVLDPYFYH
jgi:hypothetical protein